MSSSGEQLKVGIVMGSDSDLETMQHTGRALRGLGFQECIDYEERVLSAHRTPDEMVEYGAEAEQRGLEVIVAGAGGSADLPGMVASKTFLPVLAVAVTKSPDVMNLALASMIGMPEGKPLPVFQGEKGAFNAGLFSARLLMRGNRRLRKAYEKYNEELRQTSLEKDKELRELGAQTYLRNKRVERSERDFG
jgi:5-(carboxyamino)imidazole ribonucleotide mutase